MNQIKTKLLALVISVLAIGALAAVPATGSAAEGEGNAVALAGSCVANYVCIFQNANYEGERRIYSCSEAVNAEPNIYIRSALNRCGSKSNYLNNSGGSLCMAPGGERPNPGTYATLTIPVAYGNLC